MYYSKVTLIVTSSVLWPLAALAVATRFRARKIKNLPFKADDWTILASLIVFLADIILSIWATQHAGLGQLITTLGPEKMVTYFKYFYSGVILSFLVIGLSKISIVLFYKRIFGVKWFLMLANLVLAMIIIWLVGGLLSSIFCSHPISDFWNDGAKTTINFDAYLLAINSLDIAFDFMILSLPIPIIRSLQISTARKISLFFVLWLGIFCTIISMVRLWYTVKYLNDGKNQQLILENPSHLTNIATANSLWALIEEASSIIAACVPTIAPLAKDLKSIQSLISRIYSRLSTGGGSRSRKSGSNLPHSSSQGGWLELNTTYLKKATHQVEVVRNDDFSHQNYPMNSIVVKNTVSQV